MLEVLSSQIFTTIGIVTRNVMKVFANLLKEVVQRRWIIFVVKGLMITHYLILLSNDRPGDGSLICYKTLKVYEVC